MAMKILLLVMLMMALENGEAEKCRSRKDYRLMPKWEDLPHCTEPQQSLVQLPVPGGYDYVRPSVVKLKQCTGLSCKTFPKKCSPTPGNITTKAYKVHAYHADNRNYPHCVEAKVEEHGACECRCDTVCPSNRILNEITCECDCTPESKSLCDRRRIDEPNLVMWSQKTCSCLCNRKPECDTSMVWVEQICRCVAKDDLDISNEDQVDEPDEV